MPLVTAPVLHPQMNLLSQSTLSRVILQQQAVVGGSVKTESFTTLQPLKSVIQTTVNGHHTGNNGMTTNNGSQESMLLALSRPPITTAVLSNGNGRSPGVTTTTAMQISPPTYLSQAKVASGEIQLMGSNTGQVLASRVGFGLFAKTFSNSFLFAGDDGPCRSFTYQPTPGWSKHTALVIDWWWW